MNKTLMLLALMLVLSATSCRLIPAKQLDPLVLPYTLYEQEYRGNQVSVTLHTLADGPAPYSFHIAAHTAEGQTSFGVYVITVMLTEGYRQGMSINWTERIGDQRGSGGLWKGEELGSTDVWSDVGFGLDASANHPVAVFVRVVATDPGDAGITYEQTHGPVAVIQMLPNDQGIVRLDQ